MESTNDTITNRQRTCTNRGLVNVLVKLSKFHH